MIIINLIWAGVGLAVCLMAANSFKRKTGRDPWKLSPPIWAIVGALIGLIGIILVAIATRSSEVRRAQEEARQFAYASPYGGFQSEISSATPGLAPANTSAGASPGWYPVPGDPQRQSYWDGQSWGSQLQWNGMAWVDV